MDKEKELPKRKHTRLQNFDYSTTGAYFITICTEGRRRTLSQIVGVDGLASARSRSGSDTTPWCHSVPSRRLRYLGDPHTVHTEERGASPQIVGVDGLASARSRSGSDTTPWCHSLPSRRLRYLGDPHTEHTEERGASPLRQSRPLPCRTLYRRLKGFVTRNMGKASGSEGFTTTLYVTVRITKNASNILTKILFVGIMTNCLLRNKKDGSCRLFLWNREPAERGRKNSAPHLRCGGE